MAGNTKNSRNTAACLKDKTQQVSVLSVLLCCALSSCWNVKLHIHIYVFVCVCMCIYFQVFHMQGFFWQTRSMDNL